MDYTAITIIYNPISTGPSKALAHELQARLREELPRKKVTLLQTKYARHAEKLGYSLALASKRPLIISSSGDGGYSELINGVMKAQREGARPTVGLLPAGNANDHFQNLYDASRLVEHIVQSKSTKIDVLKITGMIDNKLFEHYAHSYIGFGLTPSVGKELNKTNLNFFTELRTVTRSFLSLKPVRLKLESEARYYDSIIFSNIDVMSKYLHVSKPSSVTDGKFEVTIFNRRSKVNLLLTLVRASVKGVEEDAQVSESSLQTVAPTLVQVDGEVFTLDADSEVRISIEQRAIASIISRKGAASPSAQKQAAKQQKTTSS